MRGWHISVHRQPDGGVTPARSESPMGSRLAVWQADVWGLDWVDELVKVEKAIDLGGDGYPLRYTALADYVFPQLRVDPPHARGTWIVPAGDVILPGWAGRTVIDNDAVRVCSPDESLLIEAWDESWRGLSLR